MMKGKSSGFQGTHKFSPLKFLNVFRVEYRDLFNTNYGLSVFIQFHPVKTAVFGIRIDLEDLSIKPSLALLKFRIKKDFDSITELNVFGHYFLSPAAQRGWLDAYCNRIISAELFKCHA